MYNCVKNCGGGGGIKLLLFFFFGFYVSVFSVFLVCKINDFQFFYWLILFILEVIKCLNVYRIFDFIYSGLNDGNFKIFIIGFCCF